MAKSAKAKAFGAKKKPTPAKPNPFDYKFVRPKHDVIGKSKPNKGNPLGTRKRAHEIRTNTIGAELKQLNKRNKFKDRRIGQNNPTLTNEQKSELRFIAQRKNIVSSKNRKFLLTDQDEGKDDDLGRLADRLTETERFQRGVGHIDNEEDDVDPALFAAASFGGGNLEATHDPRAFNEHGQRKSRKDMLHEIISSSKQQKAIRQRDRTVQFEQWEHLDEQFTSLRGAGELTFGRPVESKTSDDNDYADLYQKLETDRRLPALERARPLDTAAAKTTNAPIVTSAVEATSAVEEQTPTSSDALATTSVTQRTAAKTAESAINYNDNPRLRAIKMRKTLGQIMRHLGVHDAWTNKSASSKPVELIEMLEPRFEENFDARHPSHRRNDPLATKKRFTKRLRRETRSAVKELRGDSRFVAGVQARERAATSADRNEKTKKILASLQTQESEYQKRQKAAK